MRLAAPAGAAGVRPGSAPKGNETGFPGVSRAGVRGFFAPGRPPRPRRGPGRPRRSAGRRRRARRAPWSPRAAPPASWPSSSPRPRPPLLLQLLQRVLRGCVSSTASRTAAATPAVWPARLPPGRAGRRFQSLIEQGRHRRALTPGVVLAMIKRRAALDEAYRLPTCCHTFASDGEAAYFC